VLIAEVSTEFSPVRGLLLICITEGKSGFNELLSKLSEELSDLLDGLEIN
jgi:hypothetical protein